MAGPGDEAAAGAGHYSRLRASHADRDRVIDLLKAGFVQGRLAKDEFDLRVGQALASRTYGDLAALTLRIPAGPVAVQPPDLAHEPDNQPARMSKDGKIVRAWAGVIIPCPIIVAAITLAEGGGGGKAGIAAVVLAVILFTCFVAVPVTGLVILHSWHENHSSGELTS